MEICIDFDGTCVTHDFPEIGRGIGAEDVLRRLVEHGHKLILFTMRSGEGLEQAVDWFASQKIPLYGVNINPTQQQWTSSPKAYGQLYIDDAALGVPLREIGHKRPYVDWAAVEQLLDRRGLFGKKD
jgi:hypothetical protein